MPSVRTISPGESDELTLLCDEACTITVTAQAGDSATAESYRTKSGGVLVFRLDTRDFPDAETLTVDAGKCGSVSYTVVPAVSGGRRLAWRSSAGSIEHYTFPIEKSVTAETVKNRAYGTDGHLTAAAAPNGGPRSYRLTRRGPYSKPSARSRLRPKYGWRRTGDIRPST